jgi:hypothetical protein
MALALAGGLGPCPRTWFPLTSTIVAVAVYGGSRGVRAAWQNNERDWFLHGAYNGLTYIHPFKIAPSFLKLLMRIEGGYGIHPHVEWTGLVCTDVI